MGKHKSPFTNWVFMAFGIVTGVINAVLTAVFSYTYLPAAFGNPSGFLAPYAASFYGLLIMDTAYVVWYYVYLRLAESREQRALSLFMAIISLMASIAATVTQLTTNSFGLVDLSAYMETVGLIALVSMIFVTAFHILGFAVYILGAPQEKAKQKGVDMKADALDQALAEAKLRIKQDLPVIVDLFAGEIRRDVLHQLGLTEDLDLVGKHRPALPEPEEPAASKEVRASDNGRAPITYRNRNGRTNRPT